MENDESVAEFVVAFVAGAEAVSGQEAAQSHVVLGVEFHVDDAGFVADVGEEGRRLALAVEEDGHVLAVEDVEAVEVGSG